MYHGIEGRYPFLNTELIKIILKLAILYLNLYSQWNLLNLCFKTTKKI